MGISVILSSRDVCQTPRQRPPGQTHNLLGRHTTSWADTQPPGQTHNLLGRHTTSWADTQPPGQTHNLLGRHTPQADTQLDRHGTVNTTVRGLSVQSLLEVTFFAEFILL